MTSIITLKKTILTVAVLSLGLLTTSTSHAQLVPEGPGTSPPAPAPKVNATIACKIAEFKQEHNVTVNGQVGVKFHFKIEIDNAKGHKIRPTVFFFNKNDKVLKVVDPNYGNAAGEMMATNEFSPMYDQTDYVGWVFMPYSAMAPAETPAGKYQINLLASVFHVESNKFICNPVKDSMNLNIGEAAPVKNDGGLVK